MPCKIQIKQKITSKIEASTNAALGKSLDVAQSIAREVNDEYKAPVVRFVQRGTDLIDRIINVPQNLIDKYYNSELALEEEDARRVQREDARRAGEDYTDRYMFQLEQPDVRYSLKAVDILSSDRAIQIFAKGQKNGWPLSKTLTELQIPKEQKQIILDKDITDREEIITSLLADNSFVVEVNTAKNSNNKFSDCTLEIKEDEVVKFNAVRKNKAIQTDATLYNYSTLKGHIDYLQVDCEPPKTTFEILKMIPFEQCTFGVITFEHDYYADVTKSYRALSRNYLLSKGYLLVASNIAPDDTSAYEDWWVHPKHVDPEIIKIMLKADDTTKNAEKYMLGML